MASNNGMLGGLFSPNFRDLRLDEQDEERRLDTLAADPVKANARAFYGASKQIGQGLGTALAGAAGVDARSPLKRNQDAIEAAKAEVAKLGLDPDDPDSTDQFYRQVISILQKQGLAAEALAVGKEYRAEKVTRQKDDLSLREQTRKEERDKRAHELGVLRVASQTEIASARNALQRDIADARLTAEQMKTGPFKAIDYGDTVDIINRFGEVVSSKPKAMNPRDAGKDEDKKQVAATAYAEYMAGVQKQYSAAVDLYNHPGVEGITGKWGRWVGEEKEAPMLGLTASALSSKAAGAALALYKQVTGGTFLAGLAKLKQASKTGATGLGAVSEREGDKVQSDAAALDRLQQAPDFRKQLEIYIRDIEGFAGRLAAGAQADKIPPIPIATKAMAAPTQRGRPAPASAAPASPAAAQPAVAPAVGSDKVRVKMSDGRTGTIPRANLEAAKARGAVEIK